MDKTDRLFLGVAYLLLVCIVAGMGWWIGHEFDNAQEERCSLARAEMILAATQALALERETPTDYQDDVANAIIRAADEIQGVCDIMIEPADLFERLQDAVEPPPASTPD
jgi:hypothetical protein